MGCCGRRECCHKPNNRAKVGCSTVWNVVAYVGCCYTCEILTARVGSYICGNMWQMWDESCKRGMGVPMLGAVNRTKVG